MMKTFAKVEEMKIRGTIRPESHTPPPLEISTDLQREKQIHQRSTQKAVFFSSPLSRSRVPTSEPPLERHTYGRQKKGKREAKEKGRRDVILRRRPNAGATPKCASSAGLQFSTKFLQWIASIIGIEELTLSVFSASKIWKLLITCSFSAPTNPRSGKWSEKKYYKATSRFTAQLLFKSSQTTVLTEMCNSPSDVVFRPQSMQSRTTGQLLFKSSQTTVLTQICNSPSDVVFRTQSMQYRDKIKGNRTPYASVNSGEAH
ncbi:hypothetical protein Bca4012_020302 [Brassica carinata]